MDSLELRQLRQIRLVAVYAMIDQAEELHGLDRTEERQLRLERVPDRFPVRAGTLAAFAGERGYQLLE